MELSDLAGENLDIVLYNFSAR